MSVSVLNFFYLHGFASGPGSAKAKLFFEKLHQLGIPVLIPDLNQPQFEQMTLTSQLQVIDRVANSQAEENDLAIVGSSMGGLLATIYAQSRPAVKALILLAPGFEIADRWRQWLGEDGLAKWRKDGTMAVLHHSYQRHLPLSYQMFEDLANYDTNNLQVSVPTLVFHGKKDTVVPIASSLRFQRRNSDYVRLVELNDDHQLLRSMGQIWLTSERFLTEHSCVPLP